MYIVFKNIWRPLQILDFDNVVAVSHSDGYYILTCLDETKRYVDAHQYYIIAIELED